MNNIDTELFRVTEKDNMRLIVPRPDMANDNAGWSISNVWNRSRIETPNGTTVSQGYAKFWNLECGPEFAKITTASILDAIRNERKVIATLKVDGSLLIRSVYRGKLILRTRGSFSYEHHEATAAEMEIFRSKYPKLFDISLYSERTHLLFEWVTPANQIVIKYEAPELTLIGAITESHGGIKRYLRMDELKDISTTLGINLVGYFEITNIKDWYDFYHTTIAHRDIEGYVLRLNDEQNLVKVKASLYLAKHALKAELSFKKMVELWIQGGCKQSHEAILEQLQKLYDEETVMWALPYVDALYKAVDAWRAALKEVQDYVAPKMEWTRKDFAIDMQKRYVNDRLWFSIAMVLYDSSEPSSQAVRSFMDRFKDPTVERVE